MSFSILFVCTANICRSPMAERLLLARLDAAAPVVVTSAGTAGLDGRPMDEASARALLELGGEPAGHVAQSLTMPLVAGADLILTAGSVHRAAILQADPLAFRRTFTAREFARLGAASGPLTSVTDDVLRARVTEVAARRGAVEAPEPGEDDIADPFGAPWKEVQASAAQVSDAVNGVIAALGLAVTHTES